MNKLNLKYLFEYLDGFAKTISREEALESMEHKFLLNREDALSVYEKWREHYLSKNLNHFT